MSTHKPHVQLIARGDAGALTIELDEAAVLNLLMLCGPDRIDEPSLLPEYSAELRLIMGQLSHLLLDARYTNRLIEVVNSDVKHAGPITRPIE